MTGAKQGLLARSVSPLAQDIRYLIDNRVEPLDRDIVTLQEVSYVLGTWNRLSDRAIATALQELGAAGMGQSSVDGIRQSL